MEDVLHVVDELERLHPDPYFGVPREEFEAAVDGLLGRLEELSDDQVIVELMRLVALIARSGRDGHSGLQPGAAFHYLPVQLRRFSDGWFVVASGERELVGGRLVSVEGHPIEEVCRAIAPLFTRDNDTDLLSRQALGLRMPELLHALGLSAAREQVTLQLERAGAAPMDVQLAGRTWDEHMAHAHDEGTLPAVGDELWLSDPRREFWLRVLEPERALYVQYNAVVPADSEGRTLADFAAECVSTFERDHLERFVLDVRLNGGGNNTTFGPLIEALKAHPSINRRGHLFCLIGRATFSAAGNFVAALDRETEALLLGEPTGGGPNQYGDARTVTLPHHRELLLRISTRYHEFGPPGDARLANDPELRVELSSADYFAGRDPVLRAALGYRE